jgi:hypothetical protein
MDEGEMIRVDSVLQCGFMHEATDRVMSQEQAIEFLSDEIGALTSENHIATPEMYLELTKSILDFPTVVVESSKFQGWGRFRVADIGHQPVDRYARVNTVDLILDYSNPDSVTIVTTVLCGWIHGRKERAVSEPLLAWEDGICLDTPKQASPGINRQLPPFERPEVAICEAYHIGLQTGDQLISQCCLTGGAWTLSHIEQDMSTVFCQSYAPDLRESTFPSGLSKERLVFQRRLNPQGEKEMKAWVKSSRSKAAKSFE